MLDSYEADCNLNGRDLDGNLLEKARGIAGRLAGRSSVPHSETTEGEFLAREFAIPNILKMPIDAQVVSIVEARLGEARLGEVRIALAAGAHLSVIFLCGSILEAVLLGAAQQAPASFNQASATPKTADGSPKRSAGATGRRTSSRRGRGATRSFRKWYQMNQTTRSGNFPKNRSMTVRYDNVSHHGRVDTVNRHRHRLSRRHGPPCVSGFRRSKQPRSAAAGEAGREYPADAVRSSSRHITSDCRNP